LINEALVKTEECNAERHVFSVMTHRSTIEPAEECDRRYAASILRKIEGLPIAAKELIDTQSSETSYGSEAYLGNFPARNADVVQPLTNEGAMS
jgi:Asp-tRNA(Asn)/Glu-tRNA(Gln) amidotransferase A subunit family amidase